MADTSLRHRLRHTVRRGVLHKVTVRGRIAILVLTAALVVCGVAAVGVAGQRRGSAVSDRMEETAGAQRDLLELSLSRSQLEAHLQSALYFAAGGNAEAARQAIADLPLVTQDAQTNADQLSERTVPAPLRVDIADYVSDSMQYVETAQEIMEPGTLASPLRAADLERRLAALDDGIEVSVGPLVVGLGTELQALSRRGADAAEGGAMGMLAVTAGAVWFLLAAGWWTSRRLTSSLRRVGRAAEHMTSGDLETRVKHDARDEIGRVAHAINVLAGTLQDTFGRLESDARREGFRSNLSEALDIVDTEVEVFAAVALAMEKINPSAPMELLLADSSLANLETAAVSRTAGAPGCAVESPYSCAAVRRGNPLVYDDSEALNACPRLKQRPDGTLSAVCVPVSFMGRALGVLHATGPVGAPPSSEQVVRLTALATLAGNRIGTVRAFDTTRKQAHTDGLTGLANRRTMEDELRAMFANGEVFSFAMVDLDHFKRLNDSYGHEMGDRALRLFSRVARAALRDRDMIARWGGEEFAIMLRGVLSFDAVEVLNRMRGALASATLSGDTPVFTASFGVCDTAHAGNQDVLIRSADDALYAAKEAGRDRVIVAESRGAPTATRRVTEHAAQIDLSPGPIDPASGGW